MHGAECHQAPDPGRLAEAQLEPRPSALAMPDHIGPVQLQRVEECHYVGREIGRPVAIGWCVGPAEAAKIRADQPPGAREQWDQFPPGIPVLRPAVQQQHRRPAACLGNVGAQAPGLDVPVRHPRYLWHWPAGQGLRPCPRLAGALLDSH